MLMRRLHFGTAAACTSLVILAACTFTRETPFPTGDIDPNAECQIQLVNRNAQGVTVRMMDSSGVRDLGFIVPDDRKTVSAFCKDRRVGITAVADGRSGNSLGYHRCVPLAPGNLVRVVMTPLTPGVVERVCRPVGSNRAPF